MKKEKELVKNTAIIAIGKICTQFVSFLLLPFYTALLTTEQYGAVDLLSTYVQFLLPIVLLQIDQSLFRYIIDERKNEQKICEIVSSSFMFVALQCISLTVICVLLQKVIHYSYMMLLVTNVVAAGFSSIMLQLARGIGKTNIYSIASFITGTTAVAMNVFFIAVLRMNASGMMLATLLSNIICFIYVFWAIGAARFLRFRSIKTAELKRLLVYSMPLVPNALFLWIMNASDRTIVQYFLGASSNGILAIAHKFPTIYLTFFNIFSISWMESAVLHLKEEDGNDFFYNVLNTIYKLFFSCCILIIAIMPFVFNIIINAQFGDAYYQIPIYMLSALFSVVAGVYSAVYICENKTSEIAKTTVISAVINIALHVTLIKVIGLYAASISTAVAYLVVALYRIIDSRKYVKIKLSYNLIIQSIVIFCITCASYYWRNIAFCIVVFVCVFLYSIFINKNIVINMFDYSIGIVKRVFKKGE